MVEYEWASTKCAFDICNGFTWCTSPARSARDAFLTTNRAVMTVYPLPTSSTAACYNLNTCLHQSGIEVEGNFGRIPLTTRCENNCREKVPQRETRV